MKNIINFCFVIILLSWSYHIKTQQVMLARAIKARDIDQVRKYLDDGGNINLLFTQGGNTCNLVQLALQHEAEEIAEMLIKRGADYKPYFTLGNHDFPSATIDLTCLGLVLVRDDLSAGLVKTLLSMGADTDSCVRWKARWQKAGVHSLITLPFVYSLEKQQCVINFLMEKHPINLLETAIGQEKIRVENVKAFVEAGVHVSPLSAQKAKAKKQDKEVIKFLQYQVDTQEALPKLLPFSRDVCLLVASYTQGRLDSDKVEKSKSQERCVVM